MRKILSNLLFLILAANGIACACPGAAADPAEYDHSAHVAGEANQEQCHTTDCEGDCNSLSNTRALDEAALTAVVRSGADLDDFPALSQLSLIHDHWRSPDAIQNFPGADRLPGAPVTPVSLNDRMLD